MGSYELEWSDTPGEPFLAGRTLLRRLAGRMTGIAQGDIVIVATCPDCGGPHGRPAVEGSALHVGLAHCGSTVVAVASWDGPVGVDIEDLATPASRIAAVAALTGLRSLRHWTRVEAVLKADGRGLRVDPGLVRIDAASGSLRGSIAGDAATYSIDEPTVPGLQVSVALQD
jgi:4'-phosphopantetheinyl transferase